MPNNISYNISPIAVASSPYIQKFGIPRQPGLVNAAFITIQLIDSFTPDSIRGLEDFDYIWVTFIFHDAIEEGWSQLVRPPRLGGKEKKGIFATRSPHRPNHLGLSLLKLEDIIIKKNIQLICSGGDLLDQTPIVDIKPYIPFVEAIPDAASGFINGKPDEIEVVWSSFFNFSFLSKQEINLITQTIAQDPRPAYQNIPDRVYFMKIKNIEIQFNIKDKCATIIDVQFIK